MINSIHRLFCGEYGHKSPHPARLSTCRTQDEFAEVAGYYYFPAGRSGPVNFYLYLVDGKWMFYDSSAWGIESLDNVRAQFDRVIAKSSFKGLLNLLREKIELMKKWRSR